jgi:hypothetical protein
MKNIAFGIAALSLLANAPAFAAGEHGNISIQEMQQLTGMAISEFSAENAGHVQHLTGWKTWRSGSDIKVKLYVTHDGMNMEFNYNCHKHGNGVLQCHVQQ